MPAAVTDAYCSVDEYRRGVSKTDTGDDQEVAADLLAVSRYLDRKLMRHFTKDAADVARVFYPRNVLSARSRPFNWAEAENPWIYGGYSRYLFIDDLSAAPTSIKIDQDADGLFTDEDALAATDYELLPSNADKGPEAKPFTCIGIPSWSTRGGFVTGQRIEIIGRWGWPSVPVAIQRATIQITAIWRLESPRATQRVDELGNSVGVSAQAKNIVDDLVREYVRRESLI